MRASRKELSLNAKGIVVVAIPVCALLATLTVFLQFQQEARSAQDWVQHTYEVRSEMRGISLALVTADAAERGYLLTGDGALRERFRATLSEVPKELATVRGLVNDNSEQIQKLNEIRSQFSTTAEALDRMGDDPARAAAETDRLRVQLDAMQANEERLLQIRIADLRTAQDRVRVAIFAGAALGLLGGLFSALIFTTRISRRIRHLAAEAQRMERGQPVEAEGGANDEIAQLSRTLKQTSERLAGQNRELRAASQKLEQRVRERTAELLSANEQLQRVNEVRQAVVRSSPLAIWAVNLEGNVRFWNPAAERIFGWKEEEVLDRPLPIIPEDQAEEYRLWLERYKTGESLAGVERRRRTKGGSVVDVLIWTAPLRDASGRIHGALVIDDDITDRKLLEEQFRQSQKLEAVGRLAGGVAHDFNNLLTVIMGYVEMLIGEAADRPDLVDYANEIQYAADRASALTAQLLAFGRRQISQPKVLDLNEIVTHSMKLLQRIVGEDIRMEAQLAPELGKVKADPIHLDQVIMNLVVNARDAMPQGGRIILETANTLLDEHYAGRHIGVQPGHYAMLVVSDTGIGMTAETRNRLFEPFFTTKEPGKGTGLGLSIVYGIVKQAGGEIMVYSEPGHGTSIKVYLPLLEAPAEEEAAEACAAGLRGSETVLLCEDEDHIRKLVETMLTRQGYHVLPTATPDQALELARQHAGKIDLLLTDIVMPEMSGFDLSREVREIVPAIKVLLMSGYTDSRISNGWTLQPGTPFLQKPFTAVALTRKLREALEPPVTAG
jgi:two-component system cell cycle sensor histidine kinase/response regulator CckA